MHLTSQIKKTPIKDDKHDQGSERGKNFGITSSENVKTIFEIPIRSLEIRLNAMIDTNADKNYISSDFITKLDLKPTEMELPIPAECANGELINITHTTKIYF